ncbi:MAG: MBL fold metallo-hydrolase, partial [Candidatus Micrarchaeota archaeon]
MEIVFLGNGGGRIVLDQQILPTAGFRINSNNFKMHVDPGPGALVKSIEHKQIPWELDAIFVSHCHIDHCNDANMIIESLNFGNFKGGRGILVGAQSVIDGKGTFEKQLDDYFKAMLKLCKPLVAGETHKFSESISIKATKTVHEDPSDIGFVLS